ncbi:hypothetical protein ACS15_4759 [Ralstonia insidiosa]|uniref:Uncharacterized protein n=1 Tax=Ralstonia insidiosa TaxID=190721 RepID=A0AAC9BLR0_9RALS|nr:hypothetical protein ACS15_4759 [Ralstonia insidiosa]
MTFLFTTLSGGAGHRPIRMPIDLREPDGIAFPVPWPAVMPV